MNRGGHVFRHVPTSKTCVTKIETLYEMKLRNYGSPMEPGDHPEVDETDFLFGQEITKYQMLCGCAQWAVTLGRFDVQFATNTLARYATMPREGHLKRMLRLFGYLKHHLKGRIAFDMDEPNLQGLEFLDHDWKYNYPDATEELPYDAPTPKPTKNQVHITCYVDADHGHDVLSRRSVTGILLNINKTPIKWYSKRQNTVETSTYGSELVAARLATEMIMEYRYKL